ncbi:hypothetical protein [Chitinilyticum litopenaei]|uniref:hypothetical protein n=1 Tax=Chitinilyticum litopenaei TaxID=1121276 RepID=UPI000423C4CE|nr:hypothetical protein [Chitinilyticum litopenaei]
MELDEVLPGKARAVETVIAGQLRQRILYLDARYPQECAAHWASGRYTQLGLSFVENPGLATIDVLAAFSGLTSLHLMLDQTVDLAPLALHASTLKHFYCNDDLNMLKDWRAFSAIESIGQRWAGKLQFATDCTSLRNLSLTNYRAAQADLHALPELPGLSVLNLFRSNLASVRGIGRWPALRAVSLMQAPALQDLSELHVLSGLQALCIENCRKVDPETLDFTRFPGLTRLRYAASAALPSLRFARGLPQLESLQFTDTLIEDGDLQPLLEHPSLRQIVFTNKPHYSHTERAVLKALAAGRAQA